MAKRGSTPRFGVAKRETYLEQLKDGSRRHAAARAVGVAPSTVARFAAQNPEFARAIDEAEMEANEIVEDALFQAAASGNVIACQVWLYNREPDRWMDMRRVGIQAQINGEIEHRVVTDPDHLDAEIERSLGRLLGEKSANDTMRERMTSGIGEDTRMPALTQAREIIDAEVVAEEPAPAR